ncbi:MAG TPA: long-chain fatty acid--CoA ligase [Flavobacteriales bacterium]|nr:long-chain fatty acid--CoA ligase [Flavobacteriales bacterium]
MDFNQVKRIFELPAFQLKHNPLTNCLTTKYDGQWVPMSTADFITNIEKASYGLIKMGVKPGDKIATITTTCRYEWNVMDMAILQVGAINVPLYPTITSADYQYIMTEAEVTYAIVSDKLLAEKVAAVKANIPTLIDIYTFNKVAGYKNWDEILNAGDSSFKSELETRKANVNENDLATIIYTSGTTGVPKGVMLSHKNILSNAIACTERIPYGPGFRALSFLPVCHIYERMLQYLYMLTGIAIYYAESMDTIGDNIKEVKPHIFTAVPRLLEKVFDKIMAKGHEQKGIKKILFFWSVRVAEKYDPHNGIFYKIKLAIARALVFKKWKAGLGGNIEAVASGSAALQPRLARIFLGAGINVWEGYGLTETSPVIAVNCAKNDGIRIGTVGRLISGVQVKIASDGEICTKGPNLMMGYYKKPELTKEVIDAEGWFHTGDIGEFVDSDFLKITDRKKEMFKTSGGKYIAPQVIENLLKGSVYIEQVAIVGNGQKFPGALIVPKFAQARKMVEEKGVKDASNADICNDPDFKALIRQEIDNVNKGLGDWEKVKKFELLDAEFTVDGGELTPTLKLKRKFIDQKYQKLIDKIYG